MTEAVAPAARDPLARLKDELGSFEKLARERLKGTTVETVANRVKAELPRAVETKVDALLDRAGLVRKVKIPRPAVDTTGVVVAATPAVAAASPVDPDEQGCVGQVA